MTSVISKINSIIDDYKTTTLELNPVYAPTLPELIDMIDHYWVSRFKDGDDYDPNGYKKSFLNIVQNPCFIASKLIDVDTKNIELSTVPGSDYWRTWIMSKDLKQWMKEEGWGKVLNSFVYLLPKYGTVVAKKIGTKVISVPVRNIITNPKVDKLDWNMLERYTYSIDQFERIGKKKGWDNVQEIADAYRGKNQDTIDIYECYLDTDDYNWFIAITGKDKDGNDMKLDEAIKILAKSKMNIDDFPYKEVHWDKVPGRWLGRGQAENLLENQIAINENEYYFRDGLRWTSLKLFQSRDPNMGKNLLNEFENGDMIPTSAEITQVAMEERNLGAFSYADSKWQANADRNSSSQDVTRGETPPSGTPLGTTQITGAMAGAFFDIKREDLGMFLKEIIYDWVIPSFKKNKKKRHELIISKMSIDEIEELRTFFKKQHLGKRIVNYILRNRRIPNEGERLLLEKLVEEDIMSKKSIEVPDDFYENAKYTVDVTITGEQINRATRLATIQTVFQLLASNPVVMKDPTTRKIFFKMIDLAGFNPVELGLDQDMPASEKMALQQGGSIARPVMPSPSEPIQQTQNV